MWCATLTFGVEELEYRLGMKLQTKHYCLFLPVSLLAELCTDTIYSSKFVCRGDTVDVFQNITSISLNKSIVLYKQFGNITEAIATWIMQNGSYTSKINDKYHQKVSLENTNIVLKDFKTSDEAEYVLLRETTRNMIQLCELITPTSNCNLDIKQEGNFLIAFLNNPKFCGKPLVSVKWMDSPYIYYRSPDIIEVPSKNQTGTYRVCIEGKPLICVTDSQMSYNYCKTFTTYTKGERGINYISDGNSTNAYPAIDSRPNITILVLFVCVSISWILTLALNFKRFVTLCLRSRRQHRNNIVNGQEVDDDTEAILE